MNLRPPLFALAFAGLACAVAPAWAADPAAARVDSLDAALLATMKAGPSLGSKGRFRKLEPVMAEVFDLPLMTRFAVGPAWSGMTPADRQALVRAFSRLTAANYAANFDRFAGEKFVVKPDVEVRGPDRIVQSQLMANGRAPVNLVYRMRQGGGGWKIVDVYFDGVSQLTTRRSDFAGPLAAGGAKALEAHIDAAVDRLLK